MKQYKITIKGTAQLNGPVIINKSFVTDDHRLAQSFTGSRRYDVMESWIKTNYPGAKIPNIRSFAANVVPLADQDSSSGSWWQVWK